MKQITCISCPIGCRITASLVNGEFTCTGNNCKRGEEFARAELVSPVRSFATTVRTIFPGIPVLPVRTKVEVPKETIKEIMRSLKAITITERIGIGDSIITAVAETECDIIATSNILKGDSL